MKIKNKLKIFLATKLFNWAMSIAPVAEHKGYRIQIAVLQYFTDQNNFVDDTEIKKAANKYEEKSLWGDSDNTYSKEDFTSGVNWLISKLINKVND